MVKICYFLCSHLQLFNKLKYHVLLVLYAPKIYLQFTEMFQSYRIKFLWHLFCSTPDLKCGDHSSSPQIWKSMHEILGMNKAKRFLCMTRKW